MHRNVTNIIRFFMDDCLPRFIRDSRWFMYPFHYYAFKGKNITKMMEFKSYAYDLTDQEFADIYNEVECIGNDRETDLNSACLKRILLSVKGDRKKILDVGCGRGFLAKQLLAQGHEVHGCDVLKELTVPGLQYKQGNIESLPFADKSFDVVVCTHTLEHVRDLDRSINELKRVAREKLIIVVPRQKRFRYTLDLHLHFFMKKEELTERIGLKKFICEDLGGDWYYESKLK